MRLSYPILTIFLLKFAFAFSVSKTIQANSCLKEGHQIIDNGNTTTLVSPGKLFEFGFFTPDGNSNKYRYLGIWYYDESNPKIVVWVANRDAPLLESNGYLIIRNGTVKILHANGATNFVIYGELQPKFLANFTKLCLTDSGNLILSTRQHISPYPPLWQSFDHPTDTFLPGMVADATGTINLTSWQSRSSPAYGRFTLLIQQNLFSILKMGSTYLEDSSTSLPTQLSQLLQDYSSDTEAYKNTRLVINFTGYIQFWEWKRSTRWSLKWMEPNNRCSLYSACGDFGSCNTNHEFLCNCLPGFVPSAPDNWTSGDFSGGCKAKTSSCGRKSSDDIFLRLPMMKVGNLGTNVSIEGQDCKSRCLGDCHCVAYSCGAADCTLSSQSGCMLWKSTDLTGLQEQYPGGKTIFVRTTLSDIASTSRDCEPCGTYSFPYPLSTVGSCGDPSYLNFHCNSLTGQVSFLTTKGAFNVTSISAEAKTFSIQVRHAHSCDNTTIGSVLMPTNQSLLYNVRNCTVVSNQPLLEVDQPFIEVEMGWQVPHEPACNTSSDCHDWPHTSCKATREGKMKCICASGYRWDGFNLICARVHFPTKIVISCIAGVLAIGLLCGIVIVYRKCRTAQETGTVEFTADIEGADVPFFDWGSLVTATNDFSHTHKLGAGGFGSVYRGNLPDGREIAVKRLSSVTVQGIEEFRTEVSLIAKLQHRNLVRLLGYCVKADEKILVYEYMPNGSLDSCLFDDNTSVVLDWDKRFEIIFGIARGLVYLHQDSRLRIIHRDLKPSNILLDEDLNPKISDFGIARIVGGKETEASTERVVGTYGYMSPEYAYEGVFSVKSDVFSFGVVVLETISCRRNSRIFMSQHGMSLLGHAWRLWNEDKGLELADQTLEESCKQSEILKCLHIGLLCVQEDVNDRPTMSAVVLMLSSENASLPIPKQPAFSERKPPLETGSSSSAAESSLGDITLSTAGW